MSHGNKGPVLCGGAEREPVSHEVIRSVAEMADAVELLAVRIDNILQPVTTSPCPAPPVNEKITASREYPPLFREINSSLQRIRQDVARMNDTMDRVEL